MVVPALVLGGCAQSSVQTVVRRDGTWTRDIEWSSNKLGPDAFRLDNGSGKSSASSSSQPDLGETFQFPDKKLWNVTSGYLEEKKVYRAQRKFRLGETSRGEVAVLGKVKGKKQVLLSNEATMKKVGPGLWQYREVLRWKASQTAEEAINQLPIGTLKTTDLALAVKKALPPELATPQNVRELTVSVQKAVLQSLLGPPRPYLTLILLRDATAAQDWMVQYGRKVDAILLARFGDKMSSQQRYQTTRKILVPMAQSIADEKKKRLSPTPVKNEKDKKDKDKKSSVEISDSVVLNFRLNLPGKLVSSNGVVNPYTGTISWSLYPQAVLIGEVVLTATTRVAP